MRDQYAGDVSDFFKYAFLRVIAADARLGVGWYFVDHNDGRPDGKHRAWLDEGDLRPVDAPLFDALKRSRNSGAEPSVAALEALPIWPDGTIFHRDALPRSGCPAAERAAWGRSMAQHLEGCGYVFVDPDNALVFGGRASERHAHFDEVSLLAEIGRSVMFITFPGRKGTHAEQCDVLHRRLAAMAPLTLMTNVMTRVESGAKVPRSRWFTILNPGAACRERAETFAARLNVVDGVRATLTV